MRALAPLCGFVVTVLGLTFAVPVQASREFGGGQERASDRQSGQVKNRSARHESHRSSGVHQERQTALESNGSGRHGSARYPVQGGGRPSAHDRLRKSQVVALLEGRESKPTSQRSVRERAASPLRSGVRMPSASAQHASLSQSFDSPRADAFAGRRSIARATGLHTAADPLDLNSAVVLVLDQESGRTLYEKNANAVLPIASITKLMTAMVVLESGDSLHEMIEITEADVDTEKHSSSRVRVGTTLTRAELLQLALMSSENRAAHALARRSRMGLTAFVAAMNVKARALGMNDTQYSDPTGLSSRNVSTARDLSRLVRVAADQPLVRQFSTATDMTAAVPNQQVFRNTNRLIRSGDWEIDVSKTGYISEAGRCLVMQVRIQGRPTTVVLLDAFASQARATDAMRIRRWLETTEAGRITTS
ncbi:MAG: peptidase S11 [Betaproteobacteria bacterium]|nr:peptidase S11 [Betaproteobacteria bacterium]